MFLQAAYEAVGGGLLKFIDLRQVARSIGVPDADANDVIADMSSHGYVSRLGFDGTGAITERASTFVERLEALPQRPPSSEEVRAMIVSPANRNINIDSRLVNGTQSIEIARKKWWESLAEVGRRLVLSPTR